MADSVDDVIRMALLGVAAIVTIVAAGVFSKKLGVAAPLILIVIGVGFSFIPGAPTAVPHELILVGLLPPILYSAAIAVPVVDFRRNLLSISALSVALVIVTAVVTGLILYLVFPSLNLAAAIAIGAVISPTDAVAATAVAKKLGLPPRLVTILEGESLVNDATALVLLRSAIAASAGAFAFWDVVADFAFAVSVAIVIGLLVGFVTVLVRSKLRDPILDTAISFVVPFIAFIPAELVNASGVLAVVVAGLYSGHRGAEMFSAQARISERLNWRTLQFVLENGVFLLMGVQVSLLISEAHADDLSADRAIYLGLAMTGVVLVLRFTFIVPLLFALRRQREQAKRNQTRWGELLRRIRGRIERDETWANNARITRRSSQLEKTFKRRQADLDQMKAQGLGWRGGVVLGWSGMRGVVTLAAAQSLPQDTPYRAQLILIAFTVAVTTLLLQGGTLPWVIKATGIRGSDHTADQRELAALFDEIGQAGLAALENPSFVLPEGEPLDPVVVERVRNDTLLGAQSAWERAEHGDDAEAFERSPQGQYRALRREVLVAERAALLQARAEGTYSSRILTRAQALIDLEETRLEQLDS